MNVSRSHKKDLFQINGKGHIPRFKRFCQRLNTLSSSNCDPERTNSVVQYRLANIEGNSSALVASPVKHINALTMPLRLSDGLSPWRHPASNSVF